MEEKKERDREAFLKKFANVPIELRNDIIVVVDKEPISWNVAYMQIKNDTEKGKKTLNILKEIGII